MAQPAASSGGRRVTPHGLRNRKLSSRATAMPRAEDTRERSDSTELVLYDPWCGLLPRHPLLSSYFLTLAVEPRVVTDCVPIVHSYMQPLQLLKSACVCKDWTEIAARDCGRVTGRAPQTARPSASMCHRDPTTSRTRWHLMLLPPAGRPVDRSRNPGKGSLLTPVDAILYSRAGAY